MIGYLPFMRWLIIFAQFHAVCISKAWNSVPSYAFQNTLKKTPKTWIETWRQPLFGNITYPCRARFIFLLLKLMLISPAQAQVLIFSLRKSRGKEPRHKSITRAKSSCLQQAALVVVQLRWEKPSSLALQPEAGRGLGLPP